MKFPIICALASANYSDSNLEFDIQMAVTKTHVKAVLVPREIEHDYTYRVHVTDSMDIVTNHPLSYTDARLAFELMIRLHDSITGEHQFVPIDASGFFDDSFSLYKTLSRVMLMYMLDENSGRLEIVDGRDGKVLPAYSDL